MEFIFFATDLRLKVKMTPLLLILLVACSNALSSHREMALMNVTRFASGDLFSLIGTDCGLTRCMEVSHGTALAALGSISCVCQCGRDTPTFREDQRICVNHILECPMASYGRGSTKPQIPFVFLPLKGQIIYPAKEIIFTDVEDAICAVTSAQYLSPTGWVTLRDLVDNDVPFGLYRDEGSTYLQWRGSATLHARLEGRLVAVHVLCSASKPAYLATSCAAFRIAGSSRNDVRSIPFHAGELVTTEPATTGHGLSVLESVAIGVCVLLLVFVYAAGILFYVHYKQRLKRKYKDPELNISNTISTDGTTFESRMNMGSTVMGNIQDNVTFKKKDITNIHTQFQRIKNNPLLNLDGMRNDFVNDAGLSDVSEQTEDTLDSTPNSQKSRNSNIVSAMIHARHKKLVRPRATSTPDRISERLQRRSASPEIEKAPHSELSILDCSLDVKAIESLPAEPDGEPRRKLYFNPVFFETEHLKNPPPAAIEFLLKLREIMLIAKEKMVSKRFVPMLSDIPEEELYHSLDLGWDIPCARRGRRFSAISLKRENSRRAVHCGGCPGCDSVVRSANTNGLTRSNSCKTCASDEYKQKIVQKWLDDVPPPHAKKPVKSIAKVSGTPRVIEPKDKEVESRPNITQPQPMAVEDTMKISESFVKEFFNETRLKDFAKMEAQNTVKISNSKTQTKTNKDNLLLSQKVTSMNGRQIPSNHATRRVRKKLPPPPPPPTSPPLSPTSPPPSILQQTPPPVPQQTPPPIPQQPPAQNPINEKESEPVPTEVKQKMKAVISELNKCKRVESEEIYANDNIIKSVASPKLIISVSAPDSQYYSDDNLLLNGRNNSELYQNTSDFDSLERMQLKKRRFSLAYPTEVCEKNDLHNPPNMKMTRDKLTSSWRDIRKMRNDDYVKLKTKQSLTAAYVENYNITNNFSNEPLYNNVKEPGPLTIKVTGSPVYDRNNIVDDFDPDTLDRKPKKPLYDEYNERKKCVEKILLKSGGSFKYKIPTYENKTRNSPPEGVFTRKIGSLRQIYEAKAKVQETDRRLFGQRRGSVPTVSHEVAAYVKKFELSRNEDLKPPLPPKQKRITEDFSIKTNSTRGSPNSDRQRSSEERDRFSPCIRSDVSTRRSGRRSIRTRPRRIDIKKLFRTEDSGYLSTDSNESKRKTRYMIQMRPKLIPPVTFPKPTSQTKLASLHIESDTDDLESLCDGRSESGGESIETDSVFFGNFNESKRMLEELRIDEYPTVTPYRNDEYLQYRDINIILSGDSDSEHKSVISIIAGRDGRASAASVTNLDETPYINSIQC